MLTFNEVAPGIKMLKSPFGGLWSGVALVKGKENILIDSGVSSEVVNACLLPALQREGLNLSDIDWLLNTHCHGDHIGGHYRLKELSDVKVGVFHGALEKIRDPLKFSKLIRAEFPEFSPPPPLELCGVEPDAILGNGELVAGRLRLIHSPGHDDDAVCWHDEKTLTLISGDSLQGNGTELQGIGFYRDLEAYRASLDKLKKLKIKNIVTAHPYLPGGDRAIGEKAARQYLETCLYLTELYDIFIRKQWKSGEHCPSVIAGRLIEHVNGKFPAYLFLALYTVTEHLKKII